MNYYWYYIQLHLYLSLSIFLFCFLNQHSNNCASCDDIHDDLIIAFLNQNFFYRMKETTFKFCPNYYSIIILYANENRRKTTAGYTNKVIVNCLPSPVLISLKTKKNKNFQTNNQWRQLKITASIQITLKDCWLFVVVVVIRLSPGLWLKKDNYFNYACTQNTTNYINVSIKYTAKALALFPLPHSTLGSSCNGMHVWLFIYFSFFFLSSFAATECNCKVFKNHGIDNKHPHTHMVCMVVTCLYHNLWIRTSMSLFVDYYYRRRYICIRFSKIVLKFCCCCCCLWNSGTHAVAYSRFFFFQSIDILYDPTIIRSIQTFYVQMGFCSSVHIPWATELQKKKNNYKQRTDSGCVSIIFFLVCSI